MKITTRIALGLTLLSGLLLTVVGYQLRVLQEMRAINQEVAGTRVEASRVSIRLLQGVEGVREFASKSLLLGDPDYHEQWDAWEASVEDDLFILESLELDPGEAPFREQVMDAWDRYRVASDAAATPPEMDAEPASPGPAVPLSDFDPAPLDRILEGLDGMRTGVEGLLGYTEQAVVQRARVSSAAADRARQVAWWGAAGGVALAFLIGLGLYFSISGPLQRLTRGTRELSRGRFEHRLQVSGPAELAGLARDFNEMAARLDELDDMKRDFTSHVSHELKGPLAAIHETVLILLERIPGPLTAKQEHLLQLSHQSAIRLSGMITNLLEVSRLEAGALRYHPQPHRLSGIAAEVAAEMDPLLQERQLEFSGDLDPEIGPELICDGDLIRDVVANLVGNAIKFSPRGETVRVNIELLVTPPSTMPRSCAQDLAGQRGPWILLSVADRGTGVPDEHKEGIFEKFHQLQQNRRIEGQGVGLGLAISRQVVEAHEGAIWVEDREGGGSIFMCLLPTVPPRWKGLDFPAPAGTLEPPPAALPAEGHSTASIG